MSGIAIPSGATTLWVWIGPLVTSTAGPLPGVLPLPCGLPTVNYVSDVRATFYY